MKFHLSLCHPREFFTCIERANLLTISDRRDLWILREGGAGQETVKKQMEDQYALCHHKVMSGHDTLQRCSHGDSPFSRLIYILPTHIFLSVVSHAG
jgi:hypothetical protein